MMSSKNLQKKITEDIIQMLSNCLDIDYSEFEEDEELEEYGIESVTALEFCTYLYEKYNVSLKIGLIFELATIEKIVEYLLAKNRDKLELYYSEREG
ncbi:Phosphopantetheine-binding domain protein [Candidatus Magnetomorum sp. HK-1]|nr:Phosphopantetheine-binding domain protein [Candidatus Magnetomorum sp. HK-1]